MDRPRIDAIRIEHIYEWYTITAIMPGEVVGDLDNGEWYTIGVRAAADVSYDLGAPNAGCRRVQRFESVGLWGVESDSGEHLASVAREELEDLKAHLERFGVDTGNLDELATAAIAAPVTR
jgi:hypothetical protein